MTEIAAMDPLKYLLRPLDLDKAYSALPAPILIALPVTVFLTVASLMALLERAPRSVALICHMVLITPAEPRLQRI